MGGPDHVSFDFIGLTSPRQNSLREGGEVKPMKSKETGSRAPPWDPGNSLSAKGASPPKVNFKVGGMSAKGAIILLWPPACPLKGLVERKRKIAAREENWGRAGYPCTRPTITLKRTTLEERNV